MKKYTTTLIKLALILEKGTFSSDTIGDGFDSAEDLQKYAERGWRFYKWDANSPDAQIPHFRQWSVSPKLPLDNIFTLIS